MADFNLAISKTLQHEGGDKFTEDTLDHGGATKFGISQKAYTAPSNDTVIDGIL